MDLIIKAIILGIVEGITEFLPVSSTGHLIIFGHFLNFTGSFAMTFEIFIQLGAILAVVLYYGRKILDSLRNLRPGQWGFKLWIKMIIAFLPSAVVGLALNKIIEKYFFSPLTVSIALIVGAFMLIAVEKKFKDYKYSSMDKIGAKKSLYIGLAQCMSLIPGMSRSASTIMGGMMTGLSAKAAAEFSFFLAIPTMFAATGYSLVKGVNSMTAIEWQALAVGFAVSFIVAFLVVGKFLNYLGKRPLRIFAYYRLIAGAIMLVLAAAGLLG